MKLLNASFEIPNDLAEFTLRATLEGLGAKYVKTLPCVEHLKNNESYIKLNKAERQAKNAKLDFINRNRKK